MKTKHYLFSGLASASLAMLGLLPAGPAWADDAAPVVDLKDLTAKDSDPDPRTIWEESEVKLIEMIEATVDRVSKEESGGANADWPAVKKIVEDALFRHASNDNKPRVWPASQLRWVRATRKHVERSGDKARHASEDHANELRVLENLVAALQEEAAKMPDEVASKPEETVEATDDDNLWRYRDKSGARTTKPRYKGQEPVN